MLGDAGVYVRSMYMSGRRVCEISQCFDYPRQLLRCGGLVVCGGKWDAGSVVCCGQCYVGEVVWDI